MVLSTPTLAFRNDLRLPVLAGALFMTLPVHATPDLPPPQVTNARNFLAGSWAVRTCRPMRTQGVNNEIAHRICDKMLSSPWTSLKFTNTSMSSLAQNGPELAIQSWLIFRELPAGVIQEVQPVGAGHNQFENKRFQVRDDGKTLWMMTTPSREHLVFGYAESGATVMEYERVDSPPPLAATAPVPTTEPAAPSLAPTAGDRLFAGAQWSINNGCQSQGAFERLVKSMAISNGKNWKAGKPKLPEGIGSGTVTVQNRGEYSSIALPLKNVSWRGLPVTGVSLARGNQTGIGNHSIEFAASPEHVARAFADWGFAPGKSTIEAKTDWPMSITISKSKIGSQLTCDYSG